MKHARAGHGGHCDAWAPLRHGEAHGGPVVRTVSLLLSGWVGTGQRVTGVVST